MEFAQCAGEVVGAAHAGLGGMDASEEACGRRQQAELEIEAAQVGGDVQLGRHQGQRGLIGGDRGLRIADLLAGQSKQIPGVAVSLIDIERLDRQFGGGLVAVGLHCGEGALDEVVQHAVAGVLRRVFSRTGEGGRAGTTRSHECPTGCDAWWDPRSPWLIVT